MSNFTFFYDFFVIFYIFFMKTGIFACFYFFIKELIFVAYFI